MVFRLIDGNPLSSGGSLSGRYACKLNGVTIVSYIFESNGYMIQESGNKASPVGTFGVRLQYEITGNKIVIGEGGKGLVLEMVDRNTIKVPFGKALCHKE